MNHALFCTIFVVQTSKIFSQYITIWNSSLPTDEWITSPDESFSSYLSYSNKCPQIYQCYELVGSSKDNHGYIYRQINAKGYKNIRITATAELSAGSNSFSIKYSISSNPADLTSYNVLLSESDDWSSFITFDECDDISTCSILFICTTNSYSYSVYINEISAAGILIASNPTYLPTIVPTLMPTSIPTTMPTILPTTIPTLLPTTMPALLPTYAPSFNPTFNPSTKYPTNAPSLLPSFNPAYISSIQPTTKYPTRHPSFQPTHSTVIATTASMTTATTDITTSNDISFNDTIANMNNSSSLPTSMVLMVIGGFSLLLVFIIVCCICCCHIRKKFGVEKAMVEAFGTAPPAPPPHTSNDLKQEVFNKRNGIIDKDISFVVNNEHSVVINDAENISVPGKIYDLGDYNESVLPDVLVENGATTSGNINEVESSDDSSSIAAIIANDNKGNVVTFGGDSGGNKLYDGTFVIEENMDVDHIQIHTKYK